MAAPDAFDTLARYYDALMRHVDYNRWFLATTQLGGMLPTPMRHVDAACGTGRLLRELRASGWDSLGFDLSGAMLRAAKKAGPRLPLVQADLCAAPFKGAVDYATCLFDSLNFLLDEGDLRRAAGQFAAMLREGGLLYVDIVTERMILEHFAGQGWTESHEGFSTTWNCRYDRDRCVSETDIRVNQGPIATIRERVYPVERVVGAVEQAGLTVLAVMDAETWRDVRKKTLRVDIVACRGGAARLERAFKTARAVVRSFQP